jgi:hypothetical protein
MNLPKTLKIPQGILRKPKYTWFLLTLLQFLNYWTIFLLKWCFKIPRSLFRACNQRISIERTWKLRNISYFTGSRQTGDAKKILKTVLKTKLKIEETTYTLVFVKYLVVSFRSHSNRVLSKNSWFSQKTIVITLKCYNSFIV